MKKTKIKILLAVTALLSSISASAAMGFLKGEQVSGMNKICFYDVLGSTHTINVQSFELCPITYNF